MIEVDPHTGEVRGSVGTSLTPQVQPSKWSCIPTSFAIVTGVQAKDLVAWIDHNDERGFHVQECLSFLLTLGWAFTPFEFDPEVDAPKCRAWCDFGKVEVRNAHGAFEVECTECKGTGIWKLHPTKLPLKWLMERWDGVLTGRLKGGGLHAVAWDHHVQLCLDPRGVVISLESFEADTFWLATRASEARPLMEES